ncbi:thiolase family protein [Shouchella shacheensis]|uniref:thiolase family protein n=1 Tax=Shouchella shacheensis TaxID=1649580 RepID=UPI00074014A7|nr:thiolase family protein [Shouchella shacheensis]
MPEAVIVRAKRTAIGKIHGLHSQLRPETLGALVIEDLLDGLPCPPADIAEVILGNTVGEGGNIARLSLLEAGLPVGVPALTVDRQCASGLEAVILAARLIEAGAGDVYIAGGVESTSLEPKKFRASREHGKLRFEREVERASFSPERFGDPDMSTAAENVARECRISRVAQDDFALRSYTRAWAAQEKGRFEEEKIAVHKGVPDEGIRPVNHRLLQRMSPLCGKEGTVTAGNACAKNDGACALVLMSRQKCDELGLKPLVTFVGAASAGCDPRLAGLGPIPAVRKLLSEQTLTAGDLDAIEFNEAFASQVLACAHELSLPMDRLNQSGGALAFGHPYAASGAINVCRLTQELLRTGGELGLATLASAGGLGVAALFRQG